MSNFRQDVLDTKLVRFKATTPPINELDGAFWYDFATNTLKLQTQGAQGILKFVRTVQVSSAQILSLSTTTIVIVPAPPTGSYVNLIQGILRMSPGGVQYAGGGVVQFLYGATNIATLATAAVINSATASITDKTAATLGTAGVATSTVNGQALNINNATAPFTAGTGTFSVTVFYTIESTV